MEEEGNGRRQQQHWEEPNPHTSTAIVQMPQHEEEEDDDDDEAVLLQQWPTVDGPLGVQQQQALKLARAFFYAGFFLLPWLWFVNCFYFWPILRHRRYLDPVVRPYVLWSGVGFMIYSTLLLSWALTFSMGGEKVFGPVWKQLAVYDIADKFELTGY
ncbi:hypothetical protein O6H91_18G014500 [Diphasiastrum complanatum]|uniref:Uncharacterized protein n=1 Tax=Diphasiastrum complanatum TaxID=34168 RepID=A0ACC2AYD2_DIPCM|nr:hypothetical protein O6H91_18G014500 [Diphasiastrum complanatum]